MTKIECLRKGSKLAAVHVLRGATVLIAAKGFIYTCKNLASLCKNNLIWIIKHAVT